MDIDELNQQLLTLGVTPPDNLRASLYLPQLKTIAGFLQNGLAAALGAQYSQVQQAVQDSELLNDLCPAFDAFVVQAINADAQDPNTPNYPDFPTYYTARILANYPGSLDTFYGKYKVTETLLDAVTTNFQTNMQEVCNHILQDWRDLAKVFLAPGTTLTRLLKIALMGSDFHKGGKQVLRLTFETSGGITSMDDAVFVSSTLDLIYKPGDLEADCLIIGDSQAVNRAKPGFQATSLFELLNGFITQANAAQPGLNLETLPTYQILPCNPGSTLPLTNGTVDIRSSYGYLEYLYHKDYVPYTLMKNNPWLFKFYPFGSSDYKIFPGQNLTSIAQTFYRLIGQLTAIASTFSLIDLHIENIIVHEYLPYPIDLEVCLSTLVDNVNDTCLFGSWFPGVTAAEYPPVVRFREAMYNNKPCYNHAPAGDPQMAQNRLCELLSSTPLQPRDYAAQICGGCRDMLNVLGQQQKQNAFTPWLERLTSNNKVIVRYLPLGTNDFQGLLEASYSETNCSKDGQINVLVGIKRGIMYNDWNNDADKATQDPKFLALQDDYVVPDLSSADIPVFYHRIGSQNIMDSRGNQIVVPPTITYIPDPSQPTNMVTVDVDLGEERGTNYFAQAPLDMRIINGQLAQLADDDGRATRIKTLVDQIREDLGVAAPPNDLGQLVQPQLVGLTYVSD